MYVCVCVCVFVSVCLYLCVYVCVCVCVWESVHLYGPTSGDIFVFLTAYSTSQKKRLN